MARGTPKTALHIDEQLRAVIDAIPAHVRAAFASGQALEREIRLRRADGQLVAFQFQLKPSVDPRRAGDRASDIDSQCHGTRNRLGKDGKAQAVLSIDRTTKTEKRIQARIRWMENF